MDEFHTGTPQNDLRCDYNVAKFGNWPGSYGRDTLVEEAGSVVLLVEDDWLLRQSVLDELDAEGWTVMEAESGETALEVLESGMSIRLLITDIRLGGGITGWEVAEAARRQDHTLPVIYVSASPPHDARRVSDSLFLSKPCKITELLDACRMLCLR